MMPRLTDAMARLIVAVGLCALAMWGLATCMDGIAKVAVRQTVMLQAP